MNEGVNSFSFRNALLKNITDRGHFLTGFVHSVQPGVTPDGKPYEKLVATRNVAVYNPALIEKLRNAVTIEDKPLSINCSGYLTTDRRDNGKDQEPTYYDNQVVTELEIL